MGKSDHKKTNHLGPGGMNCACCGPKPGAQRQRELRAWKKKERVKAMTEALNAHFDKE